MLKRTLLFVLAPLALALLASASLVAQTGDNSGATSCYYTYQYTPDGMLIVVQYCTTSVTVYGPPPQVPYGPGSTPWMTPEQYCAANPWHPRCAASNCYLQPWLPGCPGTQNNEGGQGGATNAPAPAPTPEPTPAPEDPGKPKKSDTCANEFVPQAIPEMGTSIMNYTGDKLKDAAWEAGDVLWQGEAAVVGLFHPVVGMAMSTLGPREIQFINRYISSVLGETGGRSIMPNASTTFTRAGEQGVAKTEYGLKLERMKEVKAMGKRIAIGEDFLAAETFEGAKGAEAIQASFKAGFEWLKANGPKAVAKAVGACPK